MKLDEEKAAKAEASKLRRQRELEKMRAARKGKFDYNSYTI